MRLKTYFYTLKHLRLQQIVGRIWFKLKKINTREYPTPLLRSPQKNWLPAIPKSRSMISMNCFIFLNEEKHLNFPHSWNDNNSKKLWLYNLHYFDDLNTSDFESRKNEHLNLIDLWIEQNSVGSGNGWEPYPLSLRIVNWIKWLLLTKVSSPKIQQSLATQARILQQKLEFHLLGNHLLANAKALIFSGLFFSGPDADRWLKHGLQILDQQIQEQILADGGHFERSPMYHAIILEDILDLINLTHTYNFSTSLPLEKVVIKMLSWLKTMSHPDGEIVLFNDAAFNISANLTKLLAYTKTLQLPLDDYTAPKTRYLADTGYCYLTKNNAHVYIDAAPLGPNYLPGHGHADTLSFEFSIQQQRIIVDSGTSTYESNPERAYQRSSFAHNTITIDQQNSSEVWASFRVAQRANVHTGNLIEEDKEITFSATHDGFSRLRGKPLHQRTWRLSDSTLIIEDEIKGSKKHQIEILFHFHPDLSLLQLSPHRIQIRGKTSLLFLDLDPRLEIEIKNSFYYPEFGRALPNQKIIGKLTGNLPIALSSKLSWNLE